MASLVSTAIVALCVSAQGSYGDACKSALDAGTRQVGLRGQVDRAEDDTVKYLDTKVQATLTKEQYSVLGVTGFVFKTARDQRVKFNLPNLGLCNNINTEITPSSYNIQLNWTL